MSRSNQLRWKPRGFNWYYLTTVIVVASGAIPKGYDEGGFSASVTLPSFQNDFRLNADQWPGDANGLASRVANITSFGVLGAAFGSILALFLTDRLGRLRCWQFFVCLWASGIFIQVFSSGIIGLLLFARIWMGLGSGGLTVVAPLFLSEIAPTKTRGMIVSIYMVLLLTWLSAGFFINYGANANLFPTRLQYRLVQAVPLIPVGLAFIGSFFISDSPRWLVSTGHSEEARAALSRLRGAHTYDNRVATEFMRIEFEIQQRRNDLAGDSLWTIFKEIWSNVSYRKRFLLGIAMQTIAQWTGGNGITYYIPQIFTYAGVTGQNTSLITSGAYGVTKLVFTMIFTWGIVDILGRRLSFMSGLSLQLVAHIYMAVYTALFLDGSNKSASDAAIAAVFVYAVGWSIGLCTVQYLYGIEIFPTRIRGVCYSVNIAVHWFFQFAVVRVTPNMLVSLNVYGAFIFWACICVIGLVLLGIWAPETRGVAMEDMDRLFEGPWYTLWKAKVVMHESDSDRGGSSVATVVENTAGSYNTLGYDDEKF